MKITITCDNFDPNGIEKDVLKKIDPEKILIKTDVVLQNYANGDIYLSVHNATTLVNVIELHDALAAASKGLLK